MRKRKLLSQDFGKNLPLFLLTLLLKILPKRFRFSKVFYKYEILFVIFLS